MEPEIEFFLTGPDIDLRNVEEIGDGDDGKVIRLSRMDGKQTVAKLYISKFFLNIRKDPAFVDNTFFQEISKDQATREIKAMTLLRHHVNFLKIVKPSVFLVPLTIDDHDLIQDVPCIIMEEQENMFRFRDISKFIGFQQGNLSVSSPKPLSLRNEMNFEHRNIIFKYILNQLYEAKTVMQAANIQHRDLDTCNIMIEYPSMILKVMDFARADIPHIEGFPDTESPLNIAKTAETQMKNSKGSPNMDLWAYCLKQYSNPLNYSHNVNSEQFILKTPMFTELTDEMELSLLIDKFTTSHLQDFGWSYGTITEEGVIQENSLLIKFISYCHQIPIIKAKELTKGDIDSIRLALPKLPILGVKNYIQYIVKATQPTSPLQNFLDHPRFVIHSLAWNALHDQNNLPSQI